MQRNSTIVPNLRRDFAHIVKKISLAGIRDKMNWLEDIANQAQRSADSNNHRETYCLSKKLMNKTSLLKRLMEVRLRWRRSKLTVGLSTLLEY